MKTYTAHYLPAEGTYVDDEGETFVNGAPRRVNQAKAAKLAKMGTTHAYPNPETGLPTNHFVSSFSIVVEGSDSEDEDDGAVQPTRVVTAPEGKSKDGQTGSLTTASLKKPAAAGAPSNAPTRSLTPPTP